MLMNHVVAAAAGLVLDQPSFFSTLLKKLILSYNFFWNYLFRADVTTSMM